MDEMDFHRALFAIERMFTRSMEVELDKVIAVPADRPQRGQSIAITRGAIGAVYIQLLL
jgi:hypothetical protein